MSGVLASCLLKQSLCLWIIQLGHYQWIIKGILQAYLSKNLWGCHLVVPLKWRVAYAACSRRVNTWKMRDLKLRLNGKDEYLHLQLPSSPHLWASLHQSEQSLFIQWFERLMALYSDGAQILDPYLSLDIKSQLKHVLNLNPSKLFCNNHWCSEQKSKRNALKAKLKKTLKQWRQFISEPKSCVSL